MNGNAAPTSRIRRAVNHLATVALIGLTILGSRAEACMVCIPLPETTVADALMSAEIVVLARENPERPFSFIAVEVLKGDLKEQEIGLFLDSRTRRRLAREPDRAVVLAFGSTESTIGSTPSGVRPENSGSSESTWRSVGYATPEYESLVRAILVRAPHWRGPAGLERRAKYFMPYLTNEERSIRELAYLEVGMAPYETIRKADRFVPGDQVRKFLADPQYLDWRALYILLLGFDAAPAEKYKIRARMARIARLNLTSNLSAWAAALIEVDREKAIEWLELHFLAAPARDPDSVLEVVKALSVHGNLEASELRERIAESYGAMIETHPALAGWVARDLTAWQDWRFAEGLEDLRFGEVPLDNASEYAIDFYIRRATSRGGRQSGNGAE